jgi:hypothetical protein
MHTSTATLYRTLLLAAVVGAPLASRAEEPGPRQVVVGTYVNNVTGIDIKNNQFTIDFYVWFRWQGDDLKPLDTFELVNGRITSKTGVVKKKLGSENYALCRVLAQVNKNWDLRRFPLDAHSLELELEDGEQDDRIAVYLRDADNTGISPTLEVPGWKVTQSHGETEVHTYHTNYGDTSLPKNRESSYSRYRYTIDVVRPGYGRFLRVFFGLFIAVLISWCAFFVRPKESSPRVSLGVGATFASAAVTVAINSTLPDTNSVTMADKLVMLTLGCIVASVAETIVSLTLFARGKEAFQQRLDRVSAAIFAAFYLVTLFLIIR